MALSPMSRLTRCSGSTFGSQVRVIVTLPAASRAKACRVNLAGDSWSEHQRRLVGRPVRRLIRSADSHCNRIDAGDQFHGWAGWLALQPARRAGFG